MTPDFNLDMEQGAHFAATINWYGGGTFRAPIEDIIVGYPTRIKVTGHMLPISSDTPVIISGVQGCEILNSRNTAIDMMSRVDDDNFDAPVSTRACEWVDGTGEVTYNLPTDMTGYSGKCQLRSKWNAGEFIHEFTTDAGDMIIDPDDGSIEIWAVATDTTGFKFVKAYGDIEVTSPSGVVTRVARLTINLSREMTK